MRYADYNDGRDIVSGDRVSLIPPLDLPASFVDEHIDDLRDPDRVFVLQAEVIIENEQRQDRHRAAKLNASISILEEIIADARQGFNPDRAVTAASADLVIGLLVERLREARDLIPLDQRSPEIIRINTALAAAGVA